MANHKTAGIEDATRVRAFMLGVFGNDGPGAGMDHQFIAQVASAYVTVMPKADASDYTPEVDTEADGTDTGEDKTAYVSTEAHESLKKEAEYYRCEMHQLAKKVANLEKERFLEGDRFDDWATTKLVPAINGALNEVRRNGIH